MEDRKPKIVVSGDICINVLQWITEPKISKGFNWQIHSNMHSLLMLGESLLLAKLVALATNTSVISPKIEDIESNSLREFLRSTAELELFPLYGTGKSKDKVYRIKRFLGFTAPTWGEPKLLPVINDDADADIVIIDDENNGFNLNKEFWPLAIQCNEKSPIVLYKMNNPTKSNTLWKHLKKFHINNTIVIINAADLRSKGVNISKSLSWEKTAQDFVWQINNNPHLDFLGKCNHLIIAFGLEGAIYYSKNEEKAEAQLYFLPSEFEGSTFQSVDGKMYGITSTFVAGIVRGIVSESRSGEELSNLIGEGIREGIVAAQKYFINGFGKNIEQYKFPNTEIFIEEEDDFVHKELVQDVRIPNLTKPFHTNCYSHWYILRDKSSTSLAEIAYDIVKNGVESALEFIPIAQFGKMQTVDRTEIESYRSIKNLMWEYVCTKNTERPLCIAVFGTPGSGKSFGVTEVAGTIVPELITKLNFNLSQFKSPIDLISAFHKVRDMALKGKIPLVFFDEFDSAFEGKLGWLKYFLAPMQDGAFREGDSIHPIGKAIFVFAGGTSTTFTEFSGENIEDESEKRKFLLDFKTAKGPDFISRLRGYVNILGPNQTDKQWDQLFIIRRAMLLRSLLERKVPYLINDNGEAQIDNGVLRAMLKIPRYKHESRSMEAILDMSMLINAKKWEQSHLPTTEQLKLHVDEEQFLRYLMHDAFFSEKVESLAIDMHEKYISINQDNINVDSNFMMTWESLRGNIKDYYIFVAKDIPNALLNINYDLVSVVETPKFVEFTEDELDILVKSEHMNWYRNRKKKGWKWGEALDYKEKNDPELVQWDSISQEKKNRLYAMVKVWPEILSKSNFKLERIEDINCCSY